ncbi:hypothetical protein QYM36_014564 [Artemia franciscana]|uniref:Uncharacterized protein n=1 Tax=Artemia franciscana TaxID=6661 RepID=A0AA88HNM1_ARTSF|nr:hypothetical protein QYM36_014564 [Artemia franciscana]
MDDLIELVLKEYGIFDNFEELPSEKKGRYSNPDLGNLYLTSTDIVDMDNLFALSRSNSDTSTLSSSDPPIDDDAEFLFLINKELETFR